MRGYSFILMLILGIMVPDTSFCAEEKTEDKGLLSVLGFNKSNPTEVKSPTEAPKEDSHQQMLKSADEGDLNAQLSLGYLFLYGEGDIKPDYAKAFKYYSMAAEQGDNIAINNLGSLYYSGIGTTADVGKAMDMFEKAHQLGNVEASVNLAFLYMTDNPRSKDSTKAISLFESASNANNAIAQFMLGYSHLHGFIVEQNYSKAFDLLQKSALAKYDEAQYQTALMYIEGKGVPQNYGKAVAFLDAAIAQGHLLAMTELGTMLAEGVKYPRNIYKAHILFNLASVYGVDSAAEYRDKLSKNLKIEDLLKAQAQADTYRPAPSELTLYVRQTFGDNITAYIDRYLPKKEEPKKLEKEIKEDKTHRSTLL